LHLHHDGDTAEDLRRQLLEFKELLAERHGLLARRRDTGEIAYGFIHGNWALCNSRKGECCGVNEELVILRETGCYADFTTPSAPHCTQTRKLNSISALPLPLRHRPRDVQPGSRRGGRLARVGGRRAGPRADPRRLLPGRATRGRRDLPGGRMSTMILKQTYEQDGIHDSWESAYRCVGVDISETILKQAEQNLARSGLAGRVRFQSESLEDLSFADGTFDAVHCRGVLMHVPNWERALGQLCRVLKPGGKVVIFESNTAAVEAGRVRRVRSARSRVVRTAGGLEFCAEKDGQPMVTRIADMPYLLGRLRAFGVEPVARFATEFWDVYRFAPGLCRDLAIRFNRLWFALRLPTGPSIDNAVVGEKQGGTLGCPARAEGGPA
jgi:SAM-dependent methyltransferase